MSEGSPKSTSVLKYLDRAVGKLRDLGLMPATTEPAPIVALLNSISDIDAEKVLAIARTLNQASVFNEVVREQVGSMRIGERYETITNAFNTIRDDAKGMVDQLQDGKIDTWERLGNIWMKIARGDIASRFDKIKSTYLDVAKDTREQVDREHVILDAYGDFRGALKEAEAMALQVLERAEARLEEAKGKLNAAVEVLKTASDSDRIGRSGLELARDERLRDLQDEERRYQIAKDLADNLTVSYNTSEVVMARLGQTTGAKERLYAQSIAFFGTNETVLTALSASFTGMHGLHESTQTLEAMKEGVAKSLETLSEVGDKVQEAAVKAGYGPTLRAEAVKKLVDSVVNFQERSRLIILEMREASTRNAEEIRRTVEDGKRRVSLLAEQGAAPKS